MTKNTLNENKSFALGDRWLDLVSRRNNDSWQKPLTQKERGQLKNLADKLGPSTNEVMNWTVSHWSAFGHHAERAAGLMCSPQEPHIGFLLTHCQEAVNAMRKAAEDAERYARMQEQIAKDAVIFNERRKETAAKEALLNELRPDGRRKYSDRGEEIYYPSPEELAATMKEFQVGVTHSEVPTALDCNDQPNVKGAR